MRFASLGSGSKGNATLVEYGNTRLLVDCGFTIRETVSRLSRLGLEASDLSAILVTHEHGDHLNGVAPLSRRFNLPVYMTRGTWAARELGVIKDLNFIEGFATFAIGDIQVVPVAVPHDAREPCQYVFEAAGRVLGILTDLGSITPHVEEAFGRCDALVLEANHEPTLLALGPYPPSLKQRVSSRWGHLSNQQAADFLSRIDTARLQHLVVAHISQQNNSLDHARASLEPHCEAVAQVIYACQEEGFEWLEIRELNEHTNGVALQQATTPNSASVLKNRA